MQFSISAFCFSKNGGYRFSELYGTTYANGDQGNPLQWAQYSMKCSYVKLVSIKRSFYRFIMSLRFALWSWQSACTRVERSTSSAILWVFPYHGKLFLAVGTHFGTILFKLFRSMRGHGRRPGHTTRSFCRHLCRGGRTQPRNCPTGGHDLNSRLRVQCHPRLQHHHRPLFGYLSSGEHVPTGHQ